MSERFLYDASYPERERFPRKIDQRNLGFDSETETCELNKTGFKWQLAKIRSVL